MKQATFFIEQVYYKDSGITRNLRKHPIRSLNEVLRITEKFAVPTVAIFKIYPKVKPVVIYDDPQTGIIIAE